MPVNRLADQYLATYRDGGEFPDGLPFAKALGQANLDFSRESLDRLDRLLDQIRLQVKPQHKSYVDEQQTQNFMYLLCFYFGTVVARLSGQTVDWYQYPEMQDMLGSSGDFPHCFTTSMTCVMGGKLHFMPLVPIESRLFDEPPKNSLAQSADEFVAKFKLPLVERKRPPLAADPANRNIVMESTAEMLGSLSALCVYMIAGGSTLAPVLSADGKNMRQLMYDDLNTAVNMGLREIESNPSGVSQLGFVYDGFISLNTGRTDALIVEARHYKVVTGESTCIFSLSIALPYRHAQNEGGFLMHVPRLVNCSADKIMWPSIFQAFYYGVDSFKQPEPVWPKVYGEENAT